MSTELATLIGQRFISRKDVKAVQVNNGMYVPACDRQGNKHDCGVECKRVGWSMADLEDHISGKKTFGHYMLGTDDTVKLFAFDIDLKEDGYWMSLKEDILAVGGQPCKPREIFADNQHPGWEFLCHQLRCLAEAIAIKSYHLFDGMFDVQIAYSGFKGLHVYVFTGPTPAKEAREMAHLVLQSFNCFEATKGDNFYAHTGNVYTNMEIEIFPKQDSVKDKDLGNLMRLPLGVNKKTGHRAFFIDPRCGYNELRELDAMTALAGTDPFYTR